MAVAEVEPYLLSGGSEDPAAWASTVLLVKVVTKDGRVGWGETLTSIRAPSVVAMVRTLAKAMRGRDVHNVEANRLFWYRLDFNYSVSIESAAALSAFDMASWDIIGRELGAPLYLLFGGLSRSRVRLYANGWYGGCRDAGVSPRGPGRWLGGGTPPSSSTRSATASTCWTAPRSGGPSRPWPR